MSDLIFSEAEHVYMHHGYMLPSVSDLCAPMHKEIYSDAPKWRMEAAAERGTAVHLATQALDAHGAADVEEECLPYVRAYRDFLRDHRPSWELTESHLYHPEFLYAGTPDRYGTMDGKKTLIDVKTTYTVQRPLCRGQLNLYRLMLIARGLEVEKMLILHLKRDGTYKLIPINEDDPLALSLITIYKALHPRRKKGDKYV